MTTGGSCTLTGKTFATTSGCVIDSTAAVPLTACGRNVTAAVEVTAYQLPLPLGLQAQAAYIPDDNSLTAEKIALGKQFFWDTRWSSSGTVACVRCHQPEHGWSDLRPFSISAAG
jgi:cytochrome c peroxidase